MARRIVDVRFRLPAHPGEEGRGVVVARVPQTARVGNSTIRLDGLCSDALDLCDWCGYPIAEGHSTLCPRREEED